MYFVPPISDSDSISLQEVKCELLCLGQYDTKLTMCSETKGGERDVFNERPTREDQTTAVAPAEQKAALSTGCTIHTSMGDIVSYPTHHWDRAEVRLASQAVPRYGTEDSRKLCWTCKGW